MRQVLDYQDFPQKLFKSSLYWIAGAFEPRYLVRLPFDRPFEFLRTKLLGTPQDFGLFRLIRVIRGSNNHLLDYLLKLCLHKYMHLEAKKGNLSNKKATDIYCWVCGSNHHNLKYEINRYNVVECNSCGFVYVNPPPEPAVLEKIYTKEYFKNPAFDTLNTERYYGYDIYIEDKINIQKKFRKCLHYLKKYSKGGSLLDVGCATGFFLELAKQEGWETKGVEASEFACEYAREKLGLEVIRSTLIDVKFEAQSFDVVTMWDVIEHLLDPRSELLEVNRIMRMGGILGIITPDIEALIPRVMGKNWLELRRVPAHLSFFSVRTLKQFLNRTGFELLDNRTIGKKFKMDSLVKNLRFQDKFFKKRWMLIKYLPFKTFPITINPLYKILAFARKVEGISDKPR